MKKIYYGDIIDAGDGSDDVILQLPDDLILDMGWKPGTILNLKVEETPTGNILIMTEKK